MRVFLTILSAVAFIQLPMELHAQKLLSDADSLALEKPKPAKPTYVFPPSGIGTATLVHKDPISIELPPPRQPFEGFITLVTGLGSSRTDSSNFLLAHEIKLSDPQKSWRVHLFCTGTSSIERERVKNDDGSFSINKTKTIQLNWDSGVEGFLMEQSDTIGVFVIIPNPTSDEQLTSWLRSLNQRCEIPEMMSGPNGYMFTSYRNYALYGKIRDKHFYVVVSGGRWASLILIDEQPAGLFRSDFNDVAVITKKWRVAPYVLVDKSLDEPLRLDVLRLAMLSWLTTRSLGRPSY